MGKVWEREAARLGRKAARQASTTPSIATLGCAKGFRLRTGFQEKHTLPSSALANSAPVQTGGHK